MTRSHRPEQRSGAGLAPQTWGIPASPPDAGPPQFKATPTGASEPIKLSKPRKLKIVMDGPPGVPIPHQWGWVRLLYLTYRIFRRRDKNFPDAFKVPPLGMKELISLEEQEHRRLSDTTDIEIAVFGPKGGSGKGTVASTMAAQSAEITHQPTLICDSRHKRGNIAERFGLGRREDSDDLTVVAPRKTPTLRQVIEACAQGFFATASLTYRILRSFPGCHLDVIASDVGKKKYQGISAPHFRSTMDTLARHYRRIYHEVDNELNHPLDLELMRRCHVPVFVTNVKMPYATTELADALTIYRGMTDRGGVAMFAEKIDRFGILMVLATGKKHTREQFATRFGFRPEQVFLVPYDSYFVRIEEDDQDPYAPRKSIVNTRKMSQSSRLSYLQAQNTGFRSVQSEQAQGRVIPAPPPQGPMSLGEPTTIVPANGNPYAASLPERGTS